MVELGRGETGVVGEYADLATDRVCARDGPVLLAYRKHAVRSESIALQIGEHAPVVRGFVGPEILGQDESPAIGGRAVAISGCRDHRREHRSGALGQVA